MSIRFMYFGLSLAPALLFVNSLLFCPAASGAPSIAYQVVDRIPQDPSIFTQGFYYDGTWFYQSSGLYNKSYIARFSPSETKAKQRLDVPPNIFAEGLTVIDDDLYLISWRAGTAWRFNAADLQLEKTFHYSGEGWGLSHYQTQNDGQYSNQLIFSNGSDEIRFLSPDDFSVIRSIKVKNNGEVVDDINELEFAAGLIWANQWKSNLLYGIDPNSGEVKQVVDITELQQEAAVSHIDSVANGIAYDAEKQVFWVTGKYWRYRYSIKLQNANE